MKSTVEKLSPTRVRINVEVPFAEWEGDFDAALKQMAKQVRLPGFRPGKVPMKIVAQTYGPQVRSEVLSDAVQKAFTDAVKEANLRVAGYPRIERRTAPMPPRSSSARPSRSTPK